MENVKAIAVMQPQAVVSARLEFNAEQRQMIRDTIAPQASEPEFQMLMEVASLRRLNPLLKQIHFVPRWSKKLNRFTWSFQVSIDGFRLIADRTGQYDGQDEAEIQKDKNGRIVVCKVKVYRKGIARPFVGVAYWDEYVQKTKDGDPSDFWKRMPHTMISKCAEAIAFRKAFPEDLSGFYAPEEMAQADNEIDVTPMQSRPAQPSLQERVAEQVRELQRPPNEDEVRRTLEQAQHSGEFRMPFKSNEGHWEKDAPISTLSTEHLEGLAKWKPKKPSDVPAAAAAELKRRTNGQTAMPGMDS